MGALLRFMAQTHLMGRAVLKLVQNTFGKGRVRVLRVVKDGDRRDHHKMTIKALTTGDYARHYTHADNSNAMSTDTVKNVINVVARENLDLGPELFCKAIADKLLSSYPQAETAMVEGLETRWTRLAVDGAEHPHSFTLDANGKPYARVDATRSGYTITSGISGFTFLKATESGWANYAKDKYTTIKEVTDRIAATSMEGRWTWLTAPASYEAANAAILDAMLTVFATTYSYSVQDSLYRMACAALEAVPKAKEISLACPNKHYLLINLEPFGLDNDNQVFVATDEPHGQIECTVGRE